MTRARARTDSLLFLEVESLQKQNARKRVITNTNVIETISREAWRQKLNAKICRWGTVKLKLRAWVWKRNTCREAQLERNKASTINTGAVINPTLIVLLTQLKLHKRGITRKMMGKKKAVGDAIGEFLVKLEMMCLCSSSQCCHNQCYPFDHKTVQSFWMGKVVGHLRRSREPCVT